MKKKLSSLFIIIFTLAFITGCGKKELNVSNKNDNDTVNSKNSIAHIIEDDMTGKIVCSRVGFGDQIEAEMYYELVSINGSLGMLHSMEKVKSSDTEKLDLYEDAYLKIANNYKGIKYYDTNVIRKDDYVMNDIRINYSKVDTNKILEIEGKDNNIIRNGKIKTRTWVEFAEKLGTICKKV